MMALIAGEQRAQGINNLQSIGDLLGRNIVYDLTRLIRQRRALFGTGIDRIDAFIANSVSSSPDLNLKYITLVNDEIVEVESNLAESLIKELHKRWHLGLRADTSSAEALERNRYIASKKSRFLTRIKRKTRRIADEISGFSSSSEFTYFVASHEGIPNLQDWRSKLNYLNVKRIVAYIHDTLPFDFPEYMTQKSVLRFSAYFDGLVGSSDIVVVNSNKTLEDVKRSCERRNLTFPTITVAYPVDLIDNDRLSWDKYRYRNVDQVSDYFVTLGTVEPRKNHILLLNIWRRMVSEKVSPMPKLYIIGRKGWLNEHVIQMLDYCEPIKPFVEVHDTLRDEEIWKLMSGCRAVLLPAFAEGFCLPALEARAMGVPVVSSGFPCDEIGLGLHDVTLDPLDGKKWYTSIVSLATADLKN